MIPVGGMGGSALLRIDRESPWANAPERPGVYVEHLNGPGDYSREAQGGIRVRDPKKESRCMLKTSIARFDYQVDGTNKQSTQMPYYKTGGTITQRL